MSMLCCLKIKMSSKNCKIVIIGKMDKKGEQFNVELSADVIKVSKIHVHTVVFLCKSCLFKHLDVNKLKFNTPQW